MHPSIITGVILSGGKSSRMGSDKGLIPYKDNPMIEHVIQLIKPFCCEILISANSDAYNYLGYPVIHDEVIDIGPIGGIFTCLSQLKNTSAIFVACDMPDIEPSLIQKLIEIGSHADMVYMESDEGFVLSLPLVLNKNILSLITKQIDRKQYALHSLLSKGANTPVISCERLMVRKPPANINTPSDLENA